MELCFIRLYNLMANKIVTNPKDQKAMKQFQGLNDTINTLRPLQKSNFSQTIKTKIYIDNEKLVKKMNKFR